MSSLKEACRIIITLLYKRKDSNFTEACEDPLEIRCLAHGRWSADASFIDSWSTFKEY